MNQTNIAQNYLDKGWEYEELAKKSKDNSEKVSYYQEAINCYEEAINESPNYAHAYHSLGCVRNALGRITGDNQYYFKAVEDLSTAIDINQKKSLVNHKDLASVYANRGWSYGQLGEALNRKYHDKAIADAERAIKLDPDNSQADKNLDWSKKQLSSNVDNELDNAADTSNNTLRR